MALRVNRGEVARRDTQPAAASPTLIQRRPWILFVLRHRLRLTRIYLPVSPPRLPLARMLATVLMRPHYITLKMICGAK